LDMADLRGVGRSGGGLRLPDRNRSWDLARPQRAPLQANSDIGAFDRCLYAGAQAGHGLPDLPARRGTGRSNHPPSASKLTGPRYRLKRRDKAVCYNPVSSAAAKNAMHLCAPITRTIVQYIRISQQQDLDGPEMRPYDL
jgi:hypothetical protein